MCRNVFDEVGYVSGHVRRDRLCVGTCSVRLCYCRDLGGEVVLVSGRARRSRLLPGRVRRGLLIVGTSSARSD